MKKICLVALIVLVTTTTFGRDKVKDHLSTVYTDPFEYYKAVRNSNPVSPDEDKILDRRYSGPVIPREVFMALKEEFNLYWRCMDGRVYGCYGGASGRACQSWNTNKNPSPAIRAFCREHPDSDGPPLAGNDTPFYWTCVGKNPVMDKSIQLPQFDTLGFYKESWIVVQPISTK